MKARRGSFWLTWVLTSLLVLSAIVPTLAQESDERVETATDRSVSKILSPSLRDRIEAGDETPQYVIVFTRPGIDLADLMQVGPARIPRGGVRIVTGYAAPTRLTKIATRPGVIAILSPQDLALLGEIPPDGPLPAMPSRAELAQQTPLRLEKPGAGVQMSPPEAGGQPESYIGVELMGAREAWMKGYTGQGVIVGHTDSGTDFGHPDLENTWAVATDPRYAGWPMVYDQNSAEIYVATGEAFSTETWWNLSPGNFSYYVDTSLIVTTTVGVSLTFAMEVPSYAFGTVTNTYTFDGPPSASGVYHAGVHPEILFYMFGANLEHAAVLVVDETVPGVYSVVYVDMDQSYSFDSWERFTIDNPTGWYFDPVSGSWSRDFSGDAIADLSAGIMYWVADGANPIPGTDVIYQAPPVPGNGDLVLFYGDYNFNSHGTGTASAVVGQAVITSPVGTLGYAVLPWADVSGGVVWGTAPDAKLFSSPTAGNVFDGWLVQALGYDGTYRTGDDSQLDTNSFGYFYLHDGWDIIAQFVNWLNLEVAPETLWLSGTANGGFGYGTAASPGSAATALAVCGVNLRGTTNANEIIANPEQLLYGDLTPYSSRGPTAQGQTGPNVCSIASGATGDIPLLLATYYNGVVDGNVAWYEFGGTSQATPFTAGIGALVYQAYLEKHGSWPDWLTASEILMSTADDMNNDPFVQGSGLVNADRATDVAAGLGGLHASPMEWLVGDYRGAEYPGFSYLMMPGATDTQQFTVTNMGPVSYTVAITDDMLLKQKELTYRVTVETDEESPYNSKRPDYLVEIPLAEIPPDTDLMRVFVTQPYDQFSLGDPTIPMSMEIDSLLYVRVYNWTDLDGDGVLWQDLNGNGAVNDGELDNPPPGYPNSSQEFNSFALSYQYHTSHEVRVERPLQRTDDGLFVGLQHYENAAREIFRDLPEVHVTVKVEFYSHTDWPILTQSAASLTVPVSGTASFMASMQVPSDQEPGLYEGAIWLDDGTNKTVIPVVLNVAPVLTNTDLSFDLGFPGEPRALYDNGRVFGGQDWLGNGWLDQGDWRFFFMDVPQDLGTWAGGKWLVDTVWEDTPTDLDVLIYGPSPHTVPFSDTNLTGPYTLDLLGGSEDTAFAYDDYFPYGRYAYTFDTNTGGPREMVSADLVPGLNGVWIHNVLYGGQPDGEAFTGQAGTVALLPNPNVITTTLISGTEQLTFQSSMYLSGLEVGAFGLSQAISITNEPIGVGPELFEWVYTFTLTNTAKLEIVLSSPDVPDLDLFLERWDGTQWGSVAVSAGGTADEYIAITFPEDGQYRVGIDNFSNIPGQFNLGIRAPGGDDLWITGVPTGPIFPGQVYTMTLHWDNPNLVAGEWLGTILAGPPEAPGVIEVDKTVIFQGQYFYYLPVIFKGF